ncbi:MAG TPA: SDR family oxidoreductase [Kofleriaceae bacterium]|nr:SDR family oxidoreductase [Kofleriaceae bacterium]
MPDIYNVAVVTGAAQGIGRRIAEVLGDRGCRLVLVDLREPLDTAECLRAGGIDAITVAADVSAPDQVTALARTVEERYGRTDVLVNNAGIALIMPAEETTVDAWRRVLDVNLTGPFLLCQAFGRSMLAAGRGSIVNIASIAGLRGIADRAAYNASKHGLVGLTRTLAAEWGGRGVRVNAVCPGWVKTEMDDVAQASGRYRDDDIAGQNPMGRFATPGEIAAAVAFLADPAQSGFINGVVLPVDGGWTADASWTSLRLSKR